MNKETVYWSDAGHILELLKKYRDVYKHYLEDSGYKEPLYDEGFMDGLDFAICEICKCDVVRDHTEHSGVYIYLRDSKDGHEIAGSRFKI